jgi:hypothetical protein
MAEKIKDVKDFPISLEQAFKLLKISAMALSMNYKICLVNNVIRHLVQRNCRL